MGICRAALISIWIRVEPYSVAVHGNDQFLTIELYGDLELSGDEEKKVGHRCTQINTEKGQRGIKSNSTGMSNFQPRVHFPSVHIRVQLWPIILSLPRMDLLCNRIAGHQSLALSFDERNSDPFSVNLVIFLFAKLLIPDTVC